IYYHEWYQTSLKPQKTIFIRKNAELDMRYLSRWRTVDLPIGSGDAFGVVCFVIFGVKFVVMSLRWGLGFDFVWVRCIVVVIIV
ncbi:MAG: hypothetical protein KAS96_01180, partial [Planctomycetes bacterium]|nr:hypothetical protein [Planctomycetota bacterium]